MVTRTPGNVRHGYAVDNGVPKIIGIVKGR